MIDKKVVLITGSRKGIGRFLAEYYVEKGFMVVGCSRGPADYVSERYTHFELDVADEIQVKSLFREIRVNYGRLDVLINNAGIASMNHSLLTPISTVKSILETNVVGTFLFSREAAKIMKKNHFGRIINFVTFAIPFKLEGEAIYAASKAFLESLIKTCALENSGKGITSNAIQVGYFDAGLTHKIPTKIKNNILENIPSKRWGQIEELKNIVKMLIETEYVNGATIKVNGGTAF